MARTRYGQALRHVRTLFGVGTTGGLTDGQILERYLTADAEAAELAFTALVERHGPMVLRVCHVVLGNEHDARDAFQASFLILIHKARTLRVRDSLGPWLHQVALRVASCARGAAARRRRHEQCAAEIAARRRCDFDVWDDANLIVHDEIRRLPERYRRPIVLCCLEGLSREEAAGQLGWPLGTVQSRLARGREQLRASLTRRGVAPSVALSGAVLSADVAGAAMPAETIEPLMRAVARVAGGRSSMAEVISTGVLTLTEGVLKIMLLTHVKLAATAVLAICLAATGAGVWANQKDAPARDPAPKEDAVEQYAAGPARECSVNPKGYCISCHTRKSVEPLPRASMQHVASSYRHSSDARNPAATSEVVARVNGASITTEELVERCLTRYGSKELESLVALKLLDEACRRRGISVTDAECEVESERAARQLGMSAGDWYRHLNDQRGFSREEYFRDIVAPNLKLKKLGVDSSSVNGLEGLRGVIEKVDGVANVEVFWGRPHRRDFATKAPLQPQEDRLNAVERSLEQILKAFDDLKRLAEDRRR